MKRTYLILLALITLLFGNTEVCAGAYYEQGEAIYDDTGVSLQSLTLDYCYGKARNNHPLIKQFALAEMSAKYKSAGAGRHFLPQLSISARASWQTDVTAFSQDILDKLASMGINNIHFPDKDQYRAVVELVQPIWDGGALIFERAGIKAEAEVDRQTAEVGLYALYSQINQVYFGILLLREQLRQNDLFMDELKRQYDRVVDLERSGLANELDILRIEVEQKKLLQVKEGILKGLQAQGLMLSFYLGERVSWTSVSEVPQVPLMPNTFELSRPEITLFQAQQRQIDAQRKRLLVKGMPQLGLFAQGAYANPGLNMFDAGFTPYFIGGVSFSWNFGGLYTYGDEKKTLSVAKEKVKVQEENFRFMLNQQTIARNGEIEKLDRAILRDDEIVALREKIASMSEIKCNNGTLSISDYIGDLNELNIARQTRAIHEIELLKAMYDLRVDRGLVKD
ncbi:MAG: TolC family protein [Bacteroidales bacterium]|jgi:outer membrane protein TolC|nr:TolC family protein [Bacteroidales bacterium]